MARDGEALKEGSGQRECKAKQCVGLDNRKWGLWASHPKEAEPGTPSLEGET